jgi:hypothetical protein
MAPPAAPTRAYLALWAVFPVLVPFYLMGTVKSAPQLAGEVLSPHHPHTKVESGVPQIADFWMAGTMLLVFGGIGIVLWARYVPAVKAYAWFVAYVIVVNGIWSVWIRDSDWPLMRSALFYTYDFLLLLTFLTLYSCFGNALLRVTMYAVAASVLLQAALSPWGIDRTTVRQALFFNNPNQLGYFALLAGTVFYLCSRQVRAGVLLETVVYVAVAFLAAVSLSKAAVVALGLLLVLVFLKRPILLLLAGAFILVVLANVDSLTVLAEKLERRLDTYAADDSLEQRGYDRILNHPEYLLFGAGEGAHSRFISGHPGEMHSSWGTLLFCYGIIGTALFVWGLFLLLRRVDLRASLCLVPIFLYGSAHQGLRFSLFWVVLAVLGCLAPRAEPVPTDPVPKGPDRIPATPAPGLT